jgi:manganese/iron transport system ATP-binding protein
LAIPTLPSWQAYSKTFGGVLRHFVLNEGEGGQPRALDVITDDERAVIFQDGQATRRKPSSGDEDRS